MVPKDYYLILGVSRPKSPSGVRARYRDLVRAPEMALGATLFACT
jgi:DnaJ-class molecular chaperone